jgi:ribosomal protein S12 methylthiotransferase accessory factor
VQLLVTLNQALVPVQPFQLHAGRRQTIEAHVALHRANHRIHPLIAKHATEVGFVIRQFQVIVQLHLQHRIHRLIESELDDYTDITTLIGIEFDDNTAWGQLTILELKLLIFLALQQYEEAKECVEMFLQYNDNTAERGLFYQAMNAVLEMELDDDLELADYEANFRRMFGNERMDAVIGSVQGDVRFYGLTPTSMKLEGLDRHQRLIESYKKLHSARANITSA